MTSRMNTTYHIDPYNTCVDQKQKKHQQQKLTNTYFNTNFVGKVEEGNHSPPVEDTIRKDLWCNIVEHFSLCFWRHLLDQTVHIHTLRMKISWD